MNREDLILSHVDGQRVLDCGGADHYAFAEKVAEGEWLHDKIATRARECIGIDILKSRVDEINKTGKYKFLAANVENLQFKEEFDVVVAGEIIEHVFNAGAFLNSMWRALKPGGKLILTTPNAFSLTAVLNVMLLRRERCHPEHVTYYSPQTLRYIVERHGFKISEFETVTRPSKRFWIRALRALAIKLNPLLGEKLVLVAQKTASQTLYDGSW